jgi:transcription antitermination factor NusG
MSKRWYVIHTNTGFEDRVKNYINDRAKTENLEDLPRL